RSFQQGEGQAVFRAEAPGYESDDDHIVIPEQGRDTVPLTIRARVVSTTATTITVRVAVGDPVDPQRTGDATVSWQQVGTGGVSPASPQTIPAANIRTTPDASELAGGYRDFTITRPAPGAGAGRVVFTVTRAGRVQDLDAVDVPELPPDVPVQSTPPTATLESVGIDQGVASIELIGRPGVAGPVPHQYRYRTWVGAQIPPTFSGWTALDTSSGTYGWVLIEVPQDERHVVYVEAQVRDSNGRESAVAQAQVPPSGTIDVWGDRIGVWDGTLRPTVTASDGASAKLLPKGVLHGRCWNGSNILYEQPHQNTPTPVIFQGPTMDERSDAWYGTINDALMSPSPGSARTPGGRVKQVWSAIATPAGFEPRLVLVNIAGAPSAKSIAFSGSPLTEGQASAPVTPGSADTPSIGDRYTVTYSAVVIRGGTTGDVQAYVTVAAEVSLNGGAYAEMGTDVLTITIPNGFSIGSGSGSFQFVSPIGGGNDNVRIRFKQLEFSEPTSIGSGNVTPGSLSWNALPAAQYANATPGGEADALPFVI